MNDKALLVLQLLAFLGACQGDADSTLSDATNCFTVKMYKELSSENGNLISSPFSLDVLLSMLYVGAGGQTGKELATVLGYNNISISDMEDAFQKKMQQLMSNGSNTLEVANAIWLQDGYPVQQSFKDVVANKFQATEDSADFKNNAHGATSAINNWANSKTHGLIPVLFDQDLDPLTIMVLANAMYFKGVWQYKFNKELTQNGNFYNNDQKDGPATVKLMNQQNHFRYYEDDTLQAQVLEMDYVGGDLSMMLLLPKDGETLTSLENALTCDAFTNTLTSGYSTLVAVTMPSFDVQSSYQLVNHLKNMGIKDAFTGNANFSRIADGIYASEVVQKAIIKVNEEGSEAAVVTGVGMMRMAAAVERPPEPIPFTADHPFLYLIRHKPSNEVLFLGRVVELPSVS